VAGQSKTVQLGTSLDIGACYGLTIVGQISDVNVWDYVLAQKDLSDFANDCTSSYNVINSRKSAIFSWNDNSNKVKYTFRLPARKKLLQFTGQSLIYNNDL
jgi:hypothetical protein